LSECSERDSSPDRPHASAPSSFCHALAYMATPSRYTWYRVSFVRLPFQFDDRTNLVEANSNRLFICVRKKSCPSEDASQSSLLVTKPRSKMRKAGEKSPEVDVGRESPATGTQIASVQTGTDRHGSFASGAVYKLKLCNGKFIELCKQTSNSSPRNHQTSSDSPPLLCCSSSIPFLT